MPVSATIPLGERDGPRTAPLLIDEWMSLLRNGEADGETKRAVMKTSNRPARITIPASGDSVDGALTAKHRAWKLSGERSAR